MKLYAHPLLIAAIIAIMGAVVVWEVTEHHLFSPLTQSEPIVADKDMSAKRMVAHIDLTDAYRYLKDAQEPVSAGDMAMKLGIQNHEAETLLRILVDLDYASYVNLDGRTKFRVVNDPFAQPLATE